MEMSRQLNKILTLELCEINSSLGLIDSLIYNGYRNDQGVAFDIVKLDVQKVLSENQSRNYYIIYFIEINDVRKSFNIYSKVVDKMGLRRLKLDKIIPKYL